MNEFIADKATATATLLISSDPERGLRSKPEFHPDFEISRDGYDRLPPVFTMTELPQPAVVAADAIEHYDAYLESIPEEERSDYDLNLHDRWGDERAVTRFVNRVLSDTFEGGHFTVASGEEHIYMEGLYLVMPTYTFTIADAEGETVDFYSAPKGFEQPFRIEARVNVTRPSLLPALDEPRSQAMAEAG